MPHAFRSEEWRVKAKLLALFGGSVTHFARGIRVSRFSDIGACQKAVIFLVLMDVIVNGKTSKIIDLIG